MALFGLTTNYNFKLIDFNIATWHDDEYDNWRSIDGLLTTFLGDISFVGVWANSTAYTIGQRTVDSVDGKVYEVLVDHTSDASPTLFSADRTANPSFWQEWLATHTADTGNPHSVTAAQAGAQVDVITTRGDLTRGSSVGVAERFALGSEGQGLISDGTDLVYADPNSDKGIVINGAMTVAQRGVSITGVGASSEEYTLDRWLVYTSGSPQARATVTQESGVFGAFGYSAKIDCTTAEAAVAATELWSWQTRFEAQSLQHLRYGSGAAKTLTLTFQIKSPKAGTHCVALHQLDGTRSYVREFTVAAANAAEEITVTFPGDTSGTIDNNSDEGLRLTWPLVAGSNFQVTVDTWAAGEDYATSNQQNLLDNAANNFEITGVQLKLGSIATSFERRPFATELALCQRYYQKTFNQGVTPVQNVGAPSGAIAYRAQTAGVNLHGVYYKFPVPMRISPDKIFFSPFAASNKWYNDTDNAESAVVSISGGSDSALMISNAQEAGDGVGELIIVHATFDAEL